MMALQQWLEQRERDWSLAQHQLQSQMEALARENSELRGTLTPTQQHNLVARQRTAHTDPAFQNGTPRIQVKENM